MTLRLSRRVLCAVLLFSGSVPAWATDPIGQPADERAIQQSLPQAQDALWSKFIKCKLGYDEESGVYSIAMTPEIRALDGKTVTLHGFVLPMHGSDRT